MRRSVRTDRAQWHAMLTLTGASGSPWIELDPSIPEGDEATARACAKRVSDEARATGIVHKSVVETVEEYAVRWLADREGRVASVADDRGGGSKPARTEPRAVPTATTIAGAVEAGTRTTRAI